MQNIGAFGARKEGEKHHMRKENSNIDSGQIFKENFHELYEMSRCQSITQFAQKLQMNRQSVDRYYNGERLPDLTSIIQICRIMNVSADWLLGLTDVKTRTADLQNAINALGITEQAAQELYNPELGNPWGKTISSMVESKRFSNFISTYQIFLDFLKKLRAEDLEKMNDYEIQEDCVILGRNEAVFHYKEQVCSAMEHIYEENYNDRVAELIKDIDTPFTMTAAPFHTKLRKSKDSK